MARVDFGWIPPGRRLDLEPAPLTHKCLWPPHVASGQMKVITIFYLNMFERMQATKQHKVTTATRTEIPSQLRTTNRLRKLHQLIKEKRKGIERSQKLFSTNLIIYQKMSWGKTGSVFD